MGMGGLNKYNNTRINSFTMFLTFVYWYEKLFLINFYDFNSFFRLIDMKMEKYKKTCSSRSHQHYPGGSASAVMKRSE